MKRRDVKDLEPIDRPREKLMKYGPGKLSSEELIAMVLGSGTKRESVLKISARLLREFPGESLADVGFDRFRAAGLGPGKACALVAAFELGRRLLVGKQSALLLSPKDVWDRMADIRDKKKEHFTVFFLNVKNQEIERRIISVGTLSSNLVHPREVFEPAVGVCAAHVIVSHNHPSGSLEPSDDDVRLTARLVEAGKILGIELLDHVIVASGGFLSLRERGVV